MSSSIASSLLRRSLRLHFSSSFSCRHRQSLLYSSTSLSSSSSPLLRREIPQNPTQPSLILPLRFASSKASPKVSSKVGADEKLKRVIESEIECVQESDSLGQEAVLPDGFPFEIVDNPGDQTVILKREYAGESIQVTVFMDLDEMEDFKEDEGDDEDDDDAGGADSKESSNQPNISLVVMIDKGEGPSMELCCTVYADEIKIDSMAMKRRGISEDANAYEGPEFSDLDENLQKAFYKYLDVRGIKSSLLNFLPEYMLSKDEREYVAWLKNMKEFIEK